MTSPAPRNDQGDVVALLMGAESLDLVDDQLEQPPGVSLAVPQQRLDQAVLTKFPALIVQRFGDAVCVEHQCVSREELSFLYRAVPISEEPQYGAGGIEPFKGVIAPEEQPSEMPAIRVT